MLAGQEKPIAADCLGKFCQTREATPARPSITRVKTTAKAAPARMVGLIIVPPGRGPIGLKTRGRFQAVGLLNDGTAKNVTDQVRWSISDPAVASTAADTPGYVAGKRPGDAAIKAVLGTLTSVADIKIKDCPPIPSTHANPAEPGGPPTPTPATGHPRCAVYNSQQSSGPDCFGANANDPECALAHPTEHCGHDGEACCFDGTDDGGYCLAGQGQCRGGGAALGMCSICGAPGQQCCGDPADELGFCKSPGLNCVEQGKADAKCVLPQRVVADADRSVRVVFWNDSDRFLFRWYAHLDHGKFTDGSQYYGTPSVISPRSYVEWGTESRGFMVGTQGYAQYYVSQYGVSQGQLKAFPDLNTQEQYGIVRLDWDNPFYGDNSLGESYNPAVNNFPFDVSHVPLDPGEEAMDIPSFFRFRESGAPSYNCNPFWVENELRHTSNGPLSGFDQAAAWIATPFKRAGISSWVTSGCIGTATGSPVRSAQHSTDGFWTIDVLLNSLIVKDRSLQTYSWPLNASGRYVRIEVEPISGSQSHAYCDSHPIGFSQLTTAGAIWIDNDAETWPEVHPGKDADQFSTR